MQEAVAGATVILGLLIAFSLKAFGPVAQGIEVSASGAHIDAQDARGHCHPVQEDDEQQARAVVRPTYGREHDPQLEHDRPLFSCDRLQEPI